MMDKVDFETNVRREQIVLGCVLATPSECLERAIKGLQINNFSDLNHRAIFRGLQLLAKEDIPFDLTNLKAKLNGQVEMTYLVDLQQSVVSPIVSNFDYHLDQLADKEKTTPHEQFLKATPSSGFLVNFLEWIGPTTDACDEFKFWAGMEALAIICGRKRSIPDWGMKSIFPNLYTVKIAPSGERKSTTSYGAKRLIRQVDGTLQFYDTYSPEAMWRGLAEKAQRILFNDEFSKLLGEAKKKSFQYGAKQDLVILYDCPDEYRKKLSSEEFICKNTFICYSACTTMAWLLETIDLTDLRSGFLARFNLIPGSPKEKSLPCPPKPNEEIESYLVTVLKEIYNGDFIGMNLSAEADKLYKDWYVESEKALKKEVNAELLAPFHVRLTEEYALKYAILYSVSENPTGAIITDKHLGLAINLVEYLKICLREMILKDFIFNDSTKNRLKVLKMIEENVSLSHAKLLRNSHLKAKELREIVETLVESEQIRVISDERGNIYEAINDN